MQLDLRGSHRPSAVLFDLDGTLVNSMGMWHDIDVRFTNERGIPMPENLQMDIAGMSMYETAVYFRETFHLSDTPEELMAVWNDMAREEYRNYIDLKPGAGEFLRTLHQAGIPEGLATSNSLDLVQACFQHTGIDAYLSAVVSADEVQNGKPAPDVYLTCASKLSADPERCIVFEDVLQGIQAARNAHMKVYAVDDPYSREFLPDKKKLAAGIIRDFTELEVFV